MQEYQDIITSQKGATQFIYLNRPATYNALNKNILLEIAAAVNAANEDPEIRAIVLSATGTKAFCSGADLKEGITMRPSDSLDQYYHPAILAIRNAQKPVIGALNGVAAGAGASIAIACDYLLAKDTASLAFLFVKIGLIPDCGASYYLPQVLGVKKAFEYLSTGKTITAQDGLSFGLINEIVAEADFDNRVEAIASEFAQLPTTSIRLIKKMLANAGQNTFEQAISLEAESQDIAVQTKDAAEGVMAFLQKRKPNFIGK